MVKIDIKTAVLLNSLWHSRLPIYATGSCLHGYCFGAKHYNLYYAVAIWSNPVSRHLPQKKWLELRRLAISPDAPKFTASRMLAIMAKIIRQDKPEVNKLISYQDVEAHHGTIYKAAGWQAAHEHVGGSWFRPNSKNKSGTPRLRPDLNAAIGPKIRWEKDLS